MNLKTRKTWKSIIGLTGILVCSSLFIVNPSWPTPDKIFVFLMFVFLSFGQVWEFLKKFTPFLAAILVYESFRGLADGLNSRVEYMWMVRVDEWLGHGKLPTVSLQEKLWHGSVQWFDYSLYFVYMLHFVLPFALAILIWKKRARYYWQYVCSFVSLSFMGFFTFWAFPAAPPWLASQEGLIEPITRVSSQVWGRLGINDFPTIYSKLSPNPVAAVPSLHAAYATLFSIFIFRLFGKKWGLLSLAYPSAIYFGTVYQGEHYLIDEVLGGLYAIVAFWAVAVIFKYVRTRRLKFQKRQIAIDRIIATTDLGVSFSLIACRDYGVEWNEALKNTINLGFKRFRLMSYWSVHEQKQGEYDFSDLDAQIEIIKKSTGRISMCLGIRQPRWPETHLPEWAKSMPSREVEAAYLAFHEEVISRYKNEKIIESWQLENEFWLRSFGVNFNYSRKRLKKEFNIIRKLDFNRPIIMSTAKVISLPIFRPTPDIYATSLYRVIYSNKTATYTKTKIMPWVYKLRRELTKIVKNRETIIHELQTEPWGPKSNWEMSTAEQDKSISAKEIKLAVEFARNTEINYIDMWGAEWWFWRKTRFKDSATTKTLESILIKD